MSEIDYKDHIFALIYCGGGGTRLWPYSREKKPKQFLKIDGGKTLIRRTLERVLPIIPIERIFVITLPDYTDEVREELSEIPKKQVIVEPARRDTLLAAGLGAVVIKKRDPEAIICNLWSDQLITGVEEYRKALLAGAKTAWEEDTLVTTGIRPEYAHPGLEYVRKGQHYKDIDGVDVYRVDNFIERPERSGKDVGVIFRDKKSLWHIGLWIWKAKVFIESVNQYAPETFKTLQSIEGKMGRFGGWKHVVEEYQKSPKVQIDMVISKDEKSLFVIEGNFEWLDLGDFNVFWKMGNKDEKGNVAFLYNESEWMEVETKNSFILSDGKRQVATIGLKDAVVVVTGDAVLVTTRDQAQKVKKVVEELKKKNKLEYL